MSSSPNGRVEALPPTTTTLLSMENARTSFCLCGRISPYLRMGPGIICLAVSVASICCGIIWNAYWLCILSGFGTVGSGYAIYQGHKFKQLKTFEDNNRQLQEQLSTLSLENNRFSSEIDRLENQNSQLSEAANNFQQLLQVSQQTNREREEQNRQLHAEVQQLTESRNSFFQQASTHVQQIQQLQISFGGLRDSAESNNKVFGEKVITLSEQVELLSTSRQELSETSSEFEKCQATPESNPFTTLKSIPLKFI